MAYQARSHTPAPADGHSIKRSVKVTTSTTTGTKLVSVQNPEHLAVIAEISYIHIITGSSAACTVNIGTAATDVTSDNQMDGVSVNAAANTVYDNIEDQGTNGASRQYVTPGGFFTAYVASGDANGLVADFYWNYRTLKGGNP